MEWILGDGKMEKLDVVEPQDLKPYISANAL